MTSLTNSISKSTYSSSNALSNLLRPDINLSAQQSALAVPINDLKDEKSISAEEKDEGSHHNTSNSLEVKEIFSNESESNPVINHG